MGCGRGGIDMPMTKHWESMSFHKNILKLLTKEENMIYDVQKNGLVWTKALKQIFNINRTNHHNTKHEKGNRRICAKKTKQEEKCFLGEESHTTLNRLYCFQIQDVVKISELNRTHFSIAMVTTSCSSLFLCGAVQLFAGSNEVKRGVKKSLTVELAACQRQPPHLSWALEQRGDRAACSINDWLGRDGWVYLASSHGGGRADAGAWL